MYGGFRDGKQLSGRDVVCNFVVLSVKCQMHRAIVRCRQVQAVCIATKGLSTRSENNF